MRVVATSLSLYLPAVAGQPGGAACDLTLVSVNFIYVYFGEGF